MGVIGLWQTWALDVLGGPQRALSRSARCAAGTLRKANFSLGKMNYLNQ
jgi:hypothetical protein